MFSRRRIRAGIALLLPLMVLRALLPPGYMPVTADGELRIVMCSAGLASQDPGDTDRHSQASDTGSCLFANAATFAPPSATGFIPAIAPEISLALPVAATRPPATGPPRTAAARAPPSFS